MGFINQMLLQPNHSLRHELEGAHAGCVGSTGPVQQRGVQRQRIRHGREPVAGRQRVLGRGGTHHSQHSPQAPGRKLIEEAFGNLLRCMRWRPTARTEVCGSTLPQSEPERALQPNLGQNRPLRCLESVLPAT